MIRWTQVLQKRAQSGLAACPSKHTAEQPTVPYEDQPGHKRKYLELFLQGIKGYLYADGFA